MNRTVVSSVIGVLIMIISVIFLGTINDLWAINLGLYGLNGMFIVVPSVIWMFFFGVNIVNSLMYSAGFGYILFNQGFISDENILEMIIIGIAFAVGITFVGNAVKSEKDVNVFLHPKKQIDNNVIDVKAFFRKKHVASSFIGVDEVTVKSKFTDCGLDMSNACFNDKSTIKIKASFGSVKLILPKAIHVEIDDESINEKIKIFRRNPNDADYPSVKLSVKNSIARVEILPENDEERLNKDEIKELKRARKAHIRDVKRYTKITEVNDASETMQNTEKEVSEDLDEIINDD